MSVKLKVLSAGALFFLGGALVTAQQSKKDSLGTRDIEGVVMVGYQKKKAEVVSSAVTVVSGENLSKFNSSTMGTNALQGKAAGVDISALNGKPGGGSVINIRGVGNVTASVGASSPLFVIDGFIAGNDQRAQNMFNAISPNDYESISVLKDAAAAAIYGSQGANGVIVLTTKSGKAGKPVINFKSSIGFSEKIDDINFRMMNASERLEYQNKLVALGISGYNTVSNDELRHGHDWQKDILRKSAMQSYLLGVRAGNDKVRYALSLGYDSDNGIIRNIDAYERYTGRVKVDGTPTDRLSIGGSMGVSYTKTADIRDRNNMQNPIRAMYDYLPYEPVYVYDSVNRRYTGEYNATSQGFPILEALINQPSISQTVLFDGNIYAQYKILEDLTFKTQLGGYFSNDRDTSKTIKNSFLDKILGIGGSVTESSTNRFRYTNSNTLNYTKSFGNHNIDLLGLVEYTEYKLDYMTAQGRSFSSPTNTELSNTVTPFSTGGYNQNYRTFSYGAFLTYDYAKKYILTASVRQDTDSRFGTNYTKSEPFWSASLAWNVTNEDFLKDNSILSNLKLRGSLGVRGYNNISLNLNNILLSGGAYGSYGTMIANNNYGNPNLRWEVTKSYNIGAEFGFLKNRITGTLDFFKDTKKDFLLNMSNYGTEGGSYATTINSGNLSNKGIEFSINADVIKKRDFTWSLRANTTYVDYKLISLADGETQRIHGISMLNVGSEPWIFRLVRSAGVNPDNGNEIYLDKDGNKTEIYSGDHAVPLEGKSPLPKYYGGFGTTLAYKGFDVSADFTYKYGNYTMNYMALNMLDYDGGHTSNKRVDAINFWTKPGDTGVLPRPNNTSNAPGGIVGIQTTDRFLQDASFIRLRNVSLGYTFDKKTIGSNLPINKLRVSLTGQNLATWTKFQGDPEVSIGSGENQTGANQTFVSGAYALYSYPNTKSYLFGIEIEF